MINMQKEVKLPYKASGKILVAGGHESWYREFKNMVDGKVTYLARNKPGYSPAAINKYDFVVMMTNALSHTQYHKLLTICKNKGIPVVYFSQASAKKCVYELAQYDAMYAA